MEFVPAVESLIPPEILSPHEHYFLVKIADRILYTSDTYFRACSMTALLIATRLSLSIVENFVYVLLSIQQ